MRNSGKLLWLIAPGLLAAGCASSASAGAGLPTANYRGAVTETVTYEDAGIIIEAPDSNSAAVWSDSYYVDSCATGDAICDLKQGPQVFLASVTTTSAGTPADDGSIKPLLNHDEVYVLQFTDVPCSPVGPMRPDQAARPSGAYTCTILNFLDTESGLVLYTVQGPDLPALG